MNYVPEIANRFLYCCRHITILGPADFAIIAEWEKQDIPVAVVLESIEEVCGHKTDGETILSVADIQGKVKQNFVAWLQTKGNSATG